MGRWATACGPNLAHQTVQSNLWTGSQSCKISKRKYCGNIVSQVPQRCCLFSFCWWLSRWLPVSYHDLWSFSIKSVWLYPVVCVCDSLNSSAFSSNHPCPDFVPQRFLVLSQLLTVITSSTGSSIILTLSQTHKTACFWSTVGCFFFLFKERITVMFFLTFSFGIRWRKGEKKERNPSDDFTCTLAYALLHCCYSNTMTVNYWTLSRQWLD